MQRWHFSLGKAGLLVMGAILFLVVMNFNARLEQLDSLSQQAKQARVEATQVVQTQVALSTQMAYATSDQAVQDWAYAEGHMVQEGDVLVVPLGVPGSPPIEVSQPTPVPTPMHNWEIWWELFFGD